MVIFKNKIVPAIEILFVLVYTALYSCTDSNQNTHILFEKTEVDFGEITVNSNTSITFSFSNSGNQPLVISDIKTSCGCTVPEWKKDKIMPKEDSEIKVDIHPFKHGKFNSTVTVFYNGENSPQVLTIKGTVEYLSLLED